MHTTTLLKNNQNNVKQSWNIINSLIKNKTNKHTIPYIIHKNTKYETKKDIAEQLNIYFSTVGINQA